MSVVGGGRRSAGRLSRLVPVVAVALLLVAPGPGGAQQRPPEPGERARLEERIRERFGAIVRQQLRLDDESQRRLAEVLRDFDAERRELARARRQLRRHLGAQAPLGGLRSNPPLPGEAEAREALARMRRLHQAEARLFLREQDRLLEVLTPSQLVRFYALRERFGETVRRLQRRGPPGGGGPPGPR